MRIFILLMMFFASSLLAKQTYIVSIIPQKALLEEIVQDRADVAVMVKKGQSPHTYEPKPSQMKELSEAKVYFSIGVEFENIWLDRFKSQNKNLVISKSDRGIEKIDMETHKEHHQDHNHHHGHQHEHNHGTKDPHIWLNTQNSKAIAKNMLETLKQEEPKNADFYEKNYQLVVKKIDSINNEIKQTLKNTPPKSAFMVFHPSYGYFAKEYNLVQLPIEIEGKNPKPKELTRIIEEAREEQVKAIFAQPEFSQKFADVISKELNIEVKRFSPLSPDYLDNLLSMAKIIAR
ncbi:MAG: metal ABC transporter solute-binding protein, Zn/Mn family [Campylobacterales bacterium]